jgi:hypothetical protein
MVICDAALMDQRQDRLTPVGLLAYGHGELGGLYDVSYANGSYDVSCGRFLLSLD